MFTDLDSSVGLDFEQVSDALVRRARQDSWSGNKLTNVLWKFVLDSPFRFQGLLVGEARDPYLLRVYLRRKTTTTDTSYYLHYFFRGDADPELHNHAWTWGASVILTGGYLEERLTQERGIVGRRKFHPGSINRWKHDTFHRVTLLQNGCWTLCRTGPRVMDRSEDDWGFLDPKANRYWTHSEFRHVQESRSADFGPPL